MSAHRYTMAQMKNKTNETKKCLQCVFREYAGAINLPLQWVFAGAWDGTEILTGERKISHV